jgi:1-acyl-sn-glycerol-3-phosphate acyltransferase
MSLKKMKNAAPLYLEPEPKKTALLHTLFDGLGIYHRHKVVGGENIPTQGRALLVFNHSFITYDISILVASIRRLTGRTVMGLGDDALFKIPYVGDLLAQTGTVKASPETAEKLLETEHMVLVAPGGMREALKPSSQRNQLHWDSRKGFVRLAVKMQSPIILCACPAADDMYTVYDNALTKFFYKYTKQPVAIIRGLGLSIIPRPVKLTHYISEPQQPPAIDINDPEAFSAAVEQWHAELTDKMQKMLHDNDQ